MSAVWTNETRIAAWAACTSNHWAPTVCIQVPTLLTKDANQSHRNILYLSGAQVDEPADCAITRWISAGEAFPFGEITLTAVIVHVLRPALLVTDDIQ
jgi:hypothetical protein